MKKQIFYILCTLPVVLGIAILSIAEMQSANYRIGTTVFSGGGKSMDSPNYQTDSTLGQPSPLMQGDQSPYSENYDNDPGFWYTVAVEPVDVCEGDFNDDGSVDQLDLATFVADFGRTNCYAGEDACEGGFDPDFDVDGSDLAVFAADFGRTDCP